MNAVSPVAAAPRSWSVLKAAFDAALALERQFDDQYVDAVVVSEAVEERRAQTDRVPEWVWPVSERLTDARNDAEEALIVYPAPDLSAALWKIEYADERWRHTAGMPDAWWSAIVADLRRLADDSEAAVPNASDPAALMVELDAIDARSKEERDGAEMLEWVASSYALYDRVEALPNTGAYLAVRARAIGSLVDNTSDVAKLNLEELSAHAESNAGELIRQVLACILDAAPKSGDTPMLNIEAAA